MVPFITKGRAGFRGAWAYFCHDKQGDSAERVEWIEYRNLLADSPAKAWKIMEYTHRSRNLLKQAAGRSMGGREVTKPCFSYSLSWHPDEAPSRQEMLALADESLRVLGLEEHQVMIVCHNDEPHPHIHLVVNRNHPLTGVAATLPHSKRKLSAFASQYERDQGTIRCSGRERNREKRTSIKRRPSRDPVIGNVWAASCDGPEFVTRLQGLGYTFAGGGKRIVIIDPEGRILNPLRNLPGVRAGDFRHVIKEAFPDGPASVESVIRATRPVQRPDHQPRNTMEE
jgi:hypothetical protein